MTSLGSQGSDRIPELDEYRLATYREVGLSMGGVALLGPRRRDWAVVSPKVADLLREARTCGGIAAPAAESAWLEDLVDAGICYRKDAPRSHVPVVGQRPVPTLLLKVTGACNIACSYCYDFHESRWKGTLNLPLARSAIDKMLEASNRLAVVFHGGEPLLARDTIAEIVSYCEVVAQERNAQIAFSIQTNGLLVDEAIIAFFDAHRFDVGISLDGPALFHDATRKDHHGRGTHARLLQTVEKYPEFFHHRVGYLAVVDPGSAAELRSVIDFFRNLDVPTLKLMPRHGGGKSDVAQSGAFEPFLAILAEELELAACGSGRRPYLVNLIELIERFFGEQERNVCMANGCGAGREFLVIDAKNNLRACDITYDDAFHLSEAPSGATIDPGVIDRARGSENSLRLHQRHDQMRSTGQCSQCAWLQHCGGSCPGKALMQHGSIHGVDAIECQTRRMLFPRILELLADPRSKLLDYYRARLDDRARATAR